VFAELLLPKQPIFSGKSTSDQLLKIVKVLGTKKLYEYATEYNIEIDQSLKDILGKHSEKPFENLSNEARNLLDKMLQYDHTKRITAREAMSHDFFKLKK
jgi:casein kinase II subunit alpha